MIAISGRIKARIDHSKESHHDFAEFLQTTYKNLLDNRFFPNPLIDLAIFRPNSTTIRVKSSQLSTKAKPPCQKEIPCKGFPSSPSSFKSFTPSMRRIAGARE